MSEPKSQPAEPSVAKSNLARTNNFLLAAIVLINLYVIVLPLYPAVWFWYKSHFSHQRQALTALIQPRPKTPASPGQPVAAGDRLVIPKLLLNETIYEGKSPYTVNKGVWLWPRGSSPGKAGNSVLIGHRFTYNGPAVFYHLDLVKPGDSLGVFWQGQLYSYRVSDVRVVLPNDASIDSATKDERLTIYTCTPMWSTKYRLAVIAKRVENE